MKDGLGIKSWVRGQLVEHDTGKVVGETHPTKELIQALLQPTKEQDNGNT